MGYKDVGNPGYVINNNGFEKDQPYEFTIPCSALVGLFNSYQLCPDSICSGAKVTLQLENVLSAIRFGVNVSNVTYEIKNARFVLDTHTLIDSAQRQLSLESARSGLEFCIKSVHSELQLEPFTNELSMTVSRSVAKEH